MTEERLRPWRLSCADSAFPKISHPVALTVIKDLGIDFVDVCVFAGHTHNPPDTVIAAPRQAADVVRSRLDDAGLDAADVFVILSDPYHELAINHPDENVRDEVARRIQAVLQFAAALGSPGLTMLPGVEFAGVDTQVSRQRASIGLQRLAEVAGEQGLGLSIEPHYDSIAATRDTALDLLAGAPDLRLTLDHGHFIYQGVAQGDLDELIPRARHVQLRQAEPGDMQTPARQGVIEYRALLDSLEREGYEGLLGLEYQWDHWMNFNRVDCISETAELRDMLYDLGVAPTRPSAERG